MKWLPLSPLLAFTLALALPSFPPAHARAGTADPAPSPSPSPDDALTRKIEAFATALIAAPTDDERHRLLAAAPPELAGEVRLRRRFQVLVGKLIYLGEYDRALALSVFAGRWCEERGDRLGTVLAVWGEGNVEGSRGNNRPALAKIEEASRFFAQAGDTTREASTLCNASIIYCRLGDYRRALAGAERALAIHRKSGDKERLISDLESIGNIYLDEGQPERAATYFEEGLAQAAGDEAWQVYLFQNIASTKAARGDLAGAITLIEKTLALARKIKDRPRAGGLLTTLGDYQLESGHLDEAEKLYREALAEGEAMHDTQRRAVALLGLCDVASHHADQPGRTAQTLPEALALAERASEAARETATAANIEQACRLTGHLLRLAGRRDEARAALTEGIAAIEDERGRLTGGDVQATAFFEDKLAPYHEMVALLVDENRPAEALAFAEHGKARVLLEVLSGPRSPSDETLSATERETLQKREEAIAALNKELAAALAADRDAVEARLRLARLARESAEDDALAAHPELRRQVPPREPDANGSSLASLDPLLDNVSKNAALLEYVVGENETFAFVLRRPAGGTAETSAQMQAQVFRLPLGRAALMKRTEDYRSILAERGLDWMREARALGNDLLGPLRPALAGIESLVIVPDGPLWEFPFQTLPAAHGEGALHAADTLAGLRLSFAPSLGFLKQARGKAGANKIPVRLLAFGNPALAGPQAHGSAQLASAPAVPFGSTGMLRGDELVPLPDAEKEVQELAKLYGADNSRVFVGKDAREATFQQEAGGDYDVIHFATHGICNNSAPFYSHLLLSQVDLPPDEDGLLEAWELMRLPLHAKLVVLSACETARGRVGAGEGMIGLSWALFTAGCPSCVVSQWKVDSESNTSLMVEFHRQLRAGAGRAEALRRASLALAGQPGYGHPFYWAPFVLIGNGD